VVGLRYDTTPAQLRPLSAGVRTLLMEHANVDSLSSSRDVDIFAYVFADYGNKFLELQEELL
jgi:MscS family membrane protein